MELNQLLEPIFTYFAPKSTGLVVGNALLQGNLLDFLPFMFLILLILFVVILED